MDIYVDHCRPTSLGRTPILPGAAEKDFTHQHYKIKRIRKSDEAWVLFTWDTLEKEHVVIKALCKCKDARYNLETRSDQQECLLNAIRRNRIFTQDVYIGLAHLCYLNLDHERIGLGQVIKNPTKDMLETDVTYVLLMRRLPKETRLDVLLSEGNQFSLHYHVQVLTEYIAHIHTDVIRDAAFESLEDNEQRWGSVEQLKSKLAHNLSFGSQSFVTNKGVKYGKYYKALKDALTVLEGELLQVFEHPEYRQYFEKRAHDGYIRECHGDLKARNIWIVPNDYQNDEEPWKSVNVLDAVDFNPVYSNIDILSDFAMLVVDVQARTKSPSLVHFMTEEYLRLTNQQDEVSRSALAYYLVERAIVSAVVNIIFDNWPLLGLDFLEVAKRNLKELKLRLREHPASQGTSWKKPVVAVEPQVVSAY